MLKIKIAFALAMLVALDIAAQDQLPVVTLVSGPGKVKYQSNGVGKFQRIYPGAVIQKSSTLKVSGSAPVTVYSGGTFKQLAAGEHNLEAEFEEGKANRRLSFDNTFASYLTASLSLTHEAAGLNKQWSRLSDPARCGDGWGVTDPKKAGDGWGVDKAKGSGDGWGVDKPKGSGDGWGVDKPKGSGDGWGVDKPKGSGDGWGVDKPKGSGDGWGGQGNKIHLILPYGKVRPATATFTWSRPANVKSYTVEVKDAASGKLVHQATTVDTVFRLDLSKPPFSTGAHYEWTVSAAGKTLDSKPFEFVVLPASDQADIYKPLQRSEVYQSGDAALRGIMEAVMLERNEWFVDAAEKYNKLKKQYPKHNTVRMMYATFWMRSGFVMMAHDAVE
ncbi:MAG: hypothetical protein EP344_12435 [Bacteroidetes bacterium]|nr:MAG: hypothetical protein EP344_12435 [Bacteroidota bacterium]